MHEYVALPRKAAKIIRNCWDNKETLKDASRSRNVKVMLSLLGPALRGLVLQRGKESDHSEMQTVYTAHFNWKYGHDRPELDKLYRKAKSGQWNAETALDWGIEVDPYNPDVPLIPENIMPLSDLPAWRRLSEREKLEQGRATLSWMLSNILHGEQGALFAACQLTEAVQWFDGKLYGSTQVVDEGRHVEVFSRYLDEKLEKRYVINDNLYTILDALISDERWDIKFLGMQILVEGLALGAFGTIRQNTAEPLLRELLRYVITDEARHVHFGVVALRDYYTKVISEKERRVREDWAYEMSLLMRNRFLAREVYDEYFGHMMSWREWQRMALESEFNREFTRTLFRRIIPNLRAIGLLSDRIRPHYEALGLLRYEHDRAAPELTEHDLMAA